MNILLWICWVIDALIILESVYATYFVSSNVNREKTIVLLLLVVGVSVWLRNSSPKLALLLAGIPAGLVTIFIVGMAIALLTFKGPWH